MKTLVVSRVSAHQAVKLIVQGWELLCPVRNSTIKTVPEGWSAGTPLHGIECPNDQRHFMIHYDDAATMKEMRDRMKAGSQK